MRLPRVFLIIARYTFADANCRSMTLHCEPGTVPARTLREFPIDCSGEAVAGDQILWVEVVMGRVRRKRHMQYIGMRWVRGRIKEERVSQTTRRRLFLIEVDEVGGVRPEEVCAVSSDRGRPLLRTAKRIYRYGCHRKEWANEWTRELAIHEVTQRAEKIAGATPVNYADRARVDAELAIRRENIDRAKRQQ